MKRAFSIVAAGAALLVTATVAYWTGRRHVDMPAVAGQAPSVAAPAQATRSDVLYWYDPMVPDQHFPKPGRSPMGMEMVPRRAEPAATRDIVRVDAATVQNLGIRTAPVERRVLATGLSVPATVRWDPTQAVTVSARVDAVVNRLRVRAPYTVVAAGAPLADLLAPQWSSAVAEYGALQHMQSTDARALRDAGRDRLRALGLSSADIASAHRSGNSPTITLHAPRAGVVTTLDVREGQRVVAGQTLMTINGLGTVWIEAALPQAASGSMSPGTSVIVHVDALAGRSFRGTVDALLPDIDATTRTQVARIVLANADGTLSPGMFATVQFEPTAGTLLLAVPDDALLATGAQARVIVRESGGHFRAVAVRTGRSAGGFTEILAGLTDTDRVVVSGQFLIDSEASLSGALDRLNSDADEPAATSTSVTRDMAVPGDRQ
jgi:Cu(I)/Ag(I) efflux system membrane fusion protein